MDSENSFREDSPEGRFILELERRIDQSVQILEVAPYNVVEVPPERTWGTSRTCGILLDGPGEKVERMYLSGVSINEMAIQSIGKLTALKEMGFFRCKLPEYQNFLNPLSDLQNLEVVSILDCWLTQVPLFLKDLPDIKVLELFRNNLTELPDWLGTLPSLKILGISQNSIRTLPNSFCQSNLKELRWNYNKLSNIPSALWMLPSLEWLYLNGNNIFSVPAEIETLQGLKYLYLKGNFLQDLPLEFSQLSELTYLLLGRNTFKTIPNSITQLKKLEYLNMYRNYLKILPTALPSLSSLKYLFLDHNYLTTIPPHIGNLDKLEDLIISKNKLKEIPTSLQNLKHLFWIDLSYNKLKSIPEEIFASPELSVFNAQHNPFPEPIQRLIGREIWKIIKTMKIPRSRLLESYIHGKIHQESPEFERLWGWVTPQERWILEKNVPKHDPLLKKVHEKFSIPTDKKNGYKIYL